MRRKDEKKKEECSKLFLAFCLPRRPVWTTSSRAIVTAENGRKSYSYVSVLLMCRGSVLCKVSIQFHRITTLQDVKLTRNDSSAGTFVIELKLIIAEYLIFVLNMILHYLSFDFIRPSMMISYVLYKNADKLD